MFRHGHFQNWDIWMRRLQTWTLLSFGECTQLHNVSMSLLYLPSQLKDRHLGGQFSGFYWMLAASRMPTSRNVDGGGRNLVLRELLLTTPILAGFIKLLVGLAFFAHHPSLSTYPGSLIVSYRYWLSSLDILRGNWSVKNYNTLHFQMQNYYRIRERNHLCDLVHAGRVPLHVFFPSIITQEFIPSYLR